MPDAPVTIGEARVLLAPLASCKRVLLAVSGGPDSTALLWLAARVFPAGAGGLEIAAATVDHGLRAGSREEARQVAGWAMALGVPHTVLEWTGRKPASGVQATAREARYALLREHCRALGGAALVTAHHADDQAETVLMRLLAGSGPGGLAAMRPRSGRGGVVHLRPLLGVSKARLVATLAAAGQPWCDDPSNADPAFARTRLRRLLPLLEAEGLSRPRLLMLARRAARAEDALEAAAAESFRRWAEILPGAVQVGEAWLTVPDEIALRVLALALDAVAPAGPHRLERLERLLAEIRAAVQAHRALARTLKGCRVAVQPSGRLQVGPESPRRRGLHKG